MHAENPGMGDYFVCDVSDTIPSSPGSRPRYAVVTHNFKVRDKDTMKRSISMLGLTQLSNYLTLKGSFSAVSKPIFASKYALE